MQQVQNLHGRFQLLESKLEVHDRCFSHIRPVLTSLSSSKNTSMNVDMSNLLSRLSALELKIAKGVSDDLGPPPSDLLTRVDSLESLVRDRLT
jgi:hypothetical protein